jgi:predicted nucleotidyltransferase
MIAEIVLKRDRLAELCRRFRVKRLDLFGSAARGTFNPQTSDLDFIVFFDDAGKPGYARRYLDFAESLEQLFNRPVDLLTERSMSNPIFRENVNRSRETLYEDRSEKTVA